MTPPSRSCPEMAFPVLQAVSCLSPPILGANERVMPQGVIHLVIILLSFLFFISNLYTVETGDKAQSLVWLGT